MLASFMPATRALAVCGDGVLEEPQEQCDDGNTAAGDCCAADCQYEPYPTPCDGGSSCLAAGEAQCNGYGYCFFASPCSGDGAADLWDPGPPEDQKIKMRTRSYTPVQDLGDPAVDTQYALCIYLLDYHNLNTSALVYEHILPAGAGWRRGNRSVGYRPARGDLTPIRRARVSLMPNSRYDPARVRLRAQGAGLGLPGPFDAGHYLDPNYYDSSVCLVNDRGFAAGIRTFYQLENEPTHVHWDYIPRD